MFPAEPVYVYTPYYDRGAAAYAPNFGKVLSNPIGAGIYAPYRIQASNGQPAQYFNRALFWTSQVIPTSLHLGGLNDAASLKAILGTLNVEAVVPVY